jgi:multicomponent Na+:H+ antiporter subunit D
MMSEASAISPGLLLIVAGLVLPLLRRDARPAAMLAAPVVTLLYTWGLAAAAPAECDRGPFPGCGVFFTEADYLGLTLYPVRIDPLGLIFATVFCLAIFGGLLYALSRRSQLELSAAMVYAGGAVGAVLAGDVLTLFVYAEVMAVASTLVVWAGGPQARRAGMRYIVIHLLAGVLLMAGAAGHIFSTGETAFVPMEAATPAAWVMLLAFLINGGAPPLSAWVADAYPKASWSGMVFLSAFTTKTAVYCMIRGFPGEEVLLWVGTYMILYGIVYAMLENDMRRILAYAIVNQVGFMVVAIGAGSPEALDGAAAQAFVHILYKALLIMAAGAVILQTGRTRLTELGGLYRTMPVTTVCLLAGAATAMALPLTAGFASKALISTGVGHEHHLWPWLAITAGSAAVVFNAGVRLPWFAFFRRPEVPYKTKPEDPPLAMQAAMVFLAVLCIGLGPLYPILYGMIPNGSDYAPYKIGNISAQLQLALAGGVVFYLARGLLYPRGGEMLDWDWFWRRGGYVLAHAFGTAWIRAYARMAERALDAVRRFIRGLYRTHGPESRLAQTRPSGYMALWMTALLGVFMLFAFT